jgi:hypothetical protein
MPRVGIAMRLSDIMSIRAGYARYIVPPLVTTDTLGSARYPGFNAITTAAPVLQGIPQARLNDPFPASNPLIPPVGKTLGRYTNIGGPADWNEQEFRSGVNDRFNLSWQRQLPGLIHADITYFFNFGRDLPYNRQFNMVDPNLVYTHKAVLDQTVPNPFYNYLTPDKFPGQLRNQATVTRRSLLSPYPHYGNLTQFNTNGIRNRYQALQMKFQRNFSGGLMFLLAYNYNREKNTQFFNDIDEYASNFTWLDGNFPRHRVSLAGSYELPIGRGRRVMGNAHPVVNAVFGGWAASWLMFYNSGNYLRFPTQIAPQDSPAIDNPTRSKWFDTSGFNRQPAYTPRSNPNQYSDLTGPQNWNLDATISKFFPITERFRLELRLESYNVTNTFVPNDPTTNFTAATFGSTTNQINRGREFQYTARIHF